MKNFVIGMGERNLVILLNMIILHFPSAVYIDT